MIDPSEAVADIEEEEEPELEKVTLTERHQRRTTKWRLNCTCRWEMLYLTRRAAVQDARQHLISHGQTSNDG